MVDEKKPHARAYARDGVPGLPLQAQLDAIAAAGWSIEFASIDNLSKAAQKRRDPKELKERAEYLRPTTRTTRGLMVVASLRCLGWTMADITGALAAAGRRQTSVLAVDSGETYDTETLNEKLLTALARTETERKSAQGAAGRSAGVLAAQARREKKRAKGIAIAKALWGLPPGEMSGTEIAEKAGLSLRLLHTWLGTREDARKAAEAKLKKDKAK